MTNLSTEGSHTRTAGDRGVPEAVLELFFARELSYPDADAIATAALLAAFLDRWVLEVAPSMYIEQLEGKAGTLAKRSVLRRGPWAITAVDRHQCNAVSVTGE